MGKAMLQIGAVFAEMERNLLRERTKAGLGRGPRAGAAGRAQAKRLSPDGLDTARRLMADPRLTMEEIASRLGIGRTPLYRALARARAVTVGAAEAAKPDGKARSPGRKAGATAATASV